MSPSSGSALRSGNIVCSKQSWSAEVLWKPRKQDVWFIVWCSLDRIALLPSHSWRLLHALARSFHLMLPTSSPRDCCSSY